MSIISELFAGGYSPPFVGNSVGGKMVWCQDDHKPANQTSILLQPKV